MFTWIGTSPSGMSRGSRSGSDPGLRLGTSGWQYRHWRGLYYPSGLKQQEWFAFYSREFDTVEVNNTFYRLPERSVFEAWDERAPAGFAYAVKGNQFITHRKRLRDPDPPLEQFFDRARALVDHRGPVLWQLGPRFARDEGRLATFLAALPEDFLHAFEFRHPSWYRASVLDLLRQRGAALCLPDHPQMPTSRQLTTSWTYVRFHFGGSDGDYSSAQLDAWAARIGEWLASGIGVWAYFNNDWQAYAIKNARSLGERLLAQG